MVNKLGVYTNRYFLCSHKHLTCVFVFSLRVPFFEFRIVFLVLCYFVVVYFKFHLSDLEACQDQSFFQSDFGFTFFFLKYILLIQLL